MYHGWFVVGAAGGIEFANAATAIAILTIFIIPMTEEFGWNRTQRSGATSIGAVLGASLAPFTGRLVDRIGSRLPLVAGGLLVAAGCLYLASIQSLLGYYVAFIIVRTADQGLIKIGAAPAVGKWFHRYRGRAIALVFFGGSVGIILLAPAVQLVIDAWGWRAAWRLMGVLMLCLGVIPCLALIRRQPEDMGLAVDGGPGPASPGGEGSPLARPAGLPEREAAKDGGAWTLGEVTRTKAFWLIVVSLFLASAATSGVTLHMVPYLAGQGLGTGQAVGVISIMSASGGAGNLAVGFLAERVSPRLLMAFLYITMAGGILVLLAVTTPAQAYLFGLLHGVASGGVNALAPILWAAYYGRGILGSIHGLSRACQVAGFALGPLVLGIAYDASGNYMPALVLVALAAAGAFILVVVSRLPKNTGKNTS